MDYQSTPSSPLLLRFLQLWFIVSLFFVTLCFVRDVPLYSSVGLWQFPPPPTSPTSTTANAPTSIPSTFSIPSIDPRQCRASMFSLNECSWMHAARKVVHGDPITVIAVGSSNTRGGFGTHTLNTVQHQFVRWLNDHYPTRNASTPHRAITRAVGGVTSPVISLCLNRFIPELPIVENRRMISDDISNGDPTHPAASVDLILVDFLGDSPGFQSPGDSSSSMGRSGSASAGDEFSTRSNFERVVRIVTALASEEDNSDWNAAFAAMNNTNDRTVSEGIAAGYLAAASSSTIHDPLHQHNPKVGSCRHAVSPALMMVHYHGWPNKDASIDGLLDDLQSEYGIPAISFKNTQSTWPGESDSGFRDLDGKELQGQCSLKELFRANHGIQDAWHITAYGHSLLAVQLMDYMKRTMRRIQSHEKTICQMCQQCSAQTNSDAPRTSNDVRLSFIARSLPDAIFPWNAQPRFSCTLGFTIYDVAVADYGQNEFDLVNSSGFRFYDDTKKFKPGWVSERLGSLISFRLQLPRPECKRITMGRARDLGCLKRVGVSHVITYRDVSMAYIRVSNGVLPPSAINATISKQFASATEIANAIYPSSLPIGFRYSKPILTDGFANRMTSTFEMTVLKDDDLDVLFSNLSDEEANAPFDPLVHILTVDGITRRTEIGDLEKVGVAWRGSRFKVVGLFVA